MSKEPKHPPDNLVRPAPPPSPPCKSFAELKSIPGYKMIPAGQDEIGIDLGKLATKHGLTGCVLLSIRKDAVGVNSSGVNARVCGVMDKVASKILLKFNAGEFNDALPDNK